jgi:hypothetical protein
VGKNPALLIANTIEKAGDVLAPWPAVQKQAIALNGLGAKPGYGVSRSHSRMAAAARRKDRDL